MNKSTYITPYKILLTARNIVRIMETMRYTFKDFKAEFPDDQACLESVLENRWGKTCPRCGVVGVTFHPITGRKGFVCSECDRHLYPLKDTIFQKSTTSLWNWFYAIYLFSVAKNGVSAKELERHLGVTYKTAWRMAKQIRKLMEQDNEPLGGTVEIDETYAPSRRHTRLEGRGKKQIIFGAVERNGRINTKHVKSAGARVLLPEIQEHVAAKATIYSDEWMSYKKLPDLGYTHTTVNHGTLEYVRGEVHTNTIEGFWSQLKRSLGGTYHAISPKYLQSYLNEFAFRYNFRAVPVAPILLERAATRV